MWLDFTTNLQIKEAYRNLKRVFHINSNHLHCYDDLEIDAKVRLTRGYLATMDELTAEERNSGSGALPANEYFHRTSPVL